MLKAKTGSKKVSTKTTKKTPKPFRKRVRPIAKTTTRHDETLRRFSDVVLHVIENQLADTVFTRDDVLVLMSRVRLDSKLAWTRDAAGVNDSATGTRYRKVCDAVQSLIETRKIIALTWLKLCTASAFKTLSESTPPEVSYLPTIRRLVSACPSGTIIDAMMIVDRWRSDQHLPENVKRMTVRAVFPLLKREKVLGNGQHSHEYVVK